MLAGWRTACEGRAGVCRRVCVVAAAAGALLCFGIDVRARALLRVLLEHDDGGVAVSGSGGVEA